MTSRMMDNRTSDFKLKQLEDEKKHNKILSKLQDDNRELIKELTKMI